jgi:hypothetical protein
MVEEQGEDSEANHPFKKCNLANFINNKGYFNLVKIIGYNQQTFPFLYKLACCVAAMRVNKAGCERFFSIAGYISNPRCTSLKVQHYEALAMLKLNIQQMYINEDWVVQQYLKMEKSKEWDATDTQSDELVAALELALYADDPFEDLQLSEIESIGGDEGRVPTAAANVPIDVPGSDSTDSDNSISSDTDSDTNG